MGMAGGADTAYQRPTDIESLVGAIEGMAQYDPAAVMLVCATSTDSIMREACARARISVVDHRNNDSIVVSAAYYAFVATVLGIRGLLPAMHVMVHAVLYGYMGWSTDDEVLMRAWVPDPTLCAAITSRAAACARTDLCRPFGRMSPLLVAANITMETASARDLTSWLVVPTGRLCGADMAASLFGGRLLATVGPTLAREPRVVRVGNLAKSALAAPPDLAASPDRTIHRVRSIDPHDLLRLAGWPASDPPPENVVAVLPANDPAFWNRLRAFVDDCVVAYMPSSESTPSGCGSLARDGLVPRLSQLFDVDFCIVDLCGVPCLFVAPRRLDSARWKRAFETVGCDSPFSLPPPPLPASNNV
jgi:hypothetical protein